MRAILQPTVSFDLPRLTTLSFDPPVVSFRYGGWTLRDLRLSPAGQRHMDSCGWYDEYEPLLVHDPAVIEVHVFLPSSGGLDAATQIQLLLRKGTVPLTPTPACLAVTAALLLLESNQDIPPYIIRLAETLPKDGRMQMQVREKKIYLQSRFLDDDTHADMHLSAYRLSA